MNNSQNNSDRVDAFKRNNNLENLLTTLNNSLESAEKTALRSFVSEIDYPVIFVMGPHRSGTTLFMQWLANSGVVAYPSNLLSRFYGAPMIGAQIQLMLTDPRYNFRNEMFDFNRPISFESENGKTKGVLAPNEFWYFWRRFLPFQELDWLPDEELLKVVDKNTLVSELTTLTRVFGKPFALKGMILNYNIPFLDTIFEKAIFIQLKRNPVINVSSILDARKRQLGSEKKWYSFKIPEYPQLKDLDPITQTCGQLHYINSAVTGGIASVEESRKMVIKYEDFCRDPQVVFEELIMKLNITDRGTEYHGPKKFKESRMTDESMIKIIEKSLSHFST